MRVTRLRSRSRMATGTAGRAAGSTSSDSIGESSSRPPAQGFRLRQ
jgi:hypothetical protein